MPLKSLQERTRKKKKEGTTVTLKKTDVGRARTLSSHSVKKSRGVIAEVEVPDRHVSRKSPPGESPRRRPAAAARKTDRWEEGEKGSRGGVKVAAYAKRASGSMPQGRKKSPSRAPIKQKGGTPKKKLRSDQD